MRRPLGVILAGIVLGLIALVGTLTELVSLWAAIFMHTPGVAVGLRGIMITGTLVQLVCLVACGWTAVGLFRLSRWARIATIVIGAVMAFFAALSGVGILLMRKGAVLPTGPAAPQVQTVLAAFAAFCFLLSLIGVWWLIYFNLGSVRTVFEGAQGAMGAEPASAPMPGSRIVIMIWAWMILLSVLSVPWVVWTRMPLFFFGETLRGWVGVLVFLGLWVVEVYMALGLLWKWKPAWYLAMFFQVYAVGYIAIFLLPQVRGRFFEYVHEIVARSSQGMAAPPILLDTRFFGFCLGAGLILILVFTWALIRRRDDYLSA